MEVTEAEVVRPVADLDQVMRDIDADNSQRIQQMTAEEIEEERKQLYSALGELLSEGGEFLTR